MRTLAVAGLALGAVVIPVCVAAQAPKPRPLLPDAEYIKLAEAAGPSHVAAHAAIARMDEGGVVTRVRPGTNGFTCLVGVPGDPDAPVCVDGPALQWIRDVVWKERKPTNTVPGVAYMAKGGVHHETPSGDIVIEAGPNTTPHREPPHWMLLWPFDPTSGFATRENPSGVYIMFANTPYAHLMVYQDPTKMQPVKEY